MKQNIYQTITDYFVDALQKGQIPWTRPFETGSCGYVSHSTGRPYSFLNCMLLALQGASAGEYMTFKQAKDEGGNVKKGAKSKLITFWTMGYDKYKTVEETDPETGEKKLVKSKTEKVYAEYSQPVIVGHRVFHVEQDIEGIETKHWQPPTTHDYQPIEHVDNMLTTYRNTFNIKLNNTAGTPCCGKSLDGIYISIPEMKYAISLEEYYSTLAHETVHSTGYILGRDMTGLFGSRKYAAEELVAEIGASFLLASVGIDYTKTIDNSSAYINGWIDVLQSDPKRIAIAATQAEKAVSLILKPDLQTTLFK